jgi:N-acetylmuramoyl-L-alanine amidase
MTPVLIYLLKVIICSGLLTGYYFLTLRNRVFHQWNRFYLLGTVLLSITVPLFEYHWLPGTHTSETAIQLLQVVQGAVTEEQYITGSIKPGFTGNAACLLVYIVVSLSALIVFLRSLIKIKRIASLHMVEEIDGIRFINTNVTGTPFSFFNTIFWNRSIDIKSTTGRQILQHELVHVREWHSLDKVFMQLVLAFSWWNPVFWILRHELKMIHEFIADEKAVTDGDASTLAKLILQSACPQQYNHFINPFFHQTLKRRLTMLNRSKNPRLNYAGRLLILPLVAITLFAFTIRTGKMQYRLPADKQVIVVIDAGHGGDDAGVMSGGYNEAELTLALAKEVQSINSDPNLKIVLTRTNMDKVDLKLRTQICSDVNANAFISLHINGKPEGASTMHRYSGFQVFIPNKDVTYKEGSKLLGSALVQKVSEVYETFPSLTQRKMGIWVLNQNVCPSVLIECGYLTNEKDRQFITQEGNRKALAKKILEAIVLFSDGNGIRSYGVNAPADTR